MVKHFARLKQRAALRKLFNLPPNRPHHVKSYYVSGTKLFLRRYTEIYRYLLSKRFKNPVLGCQEIVHCNFFFVMPNRNISAGKWVGCIAGSYHFRFQVSRGL